MRNVPPGRFHVHPMRQRTQQARPYLKEGNSLGGSGIKDARSGINPATSVNQRGSDVERWVFKENNSIKKNKKTTKLFGLSEFTMMVFFQHNVPEVLELRSCVP